MFGLIRNLPAVAVGFFCLTGLVSCAVAGDRVYGGRVLDYETKDPIEGAVVVAYWLERMAHPGAADTRLKEVKEILTDKNGEWSLTGPEEERGDSVYSYLTATYFIQHPRFIVFKPGYCSWPNGFALDACRGNLKPGGAGKVAEGENVELPMLKTRDRETLIRNTPSLEMGREAAGKLPLFRNLIDQEESKIPRR